MKKSSADWLSRALHVCGIGIVNGRYVYQKFNVVEIANLKNAEAKLGGEGHITTHEHAPDKT